MPYAFKPISSADTSLFQSVVHKHQQIDSGSAGLYIIQYRSGSKTDTYQRISQSISESYWHSVDTLYYKSSSLRRTDNETAYFFRTVIRENIDGKIQHLNKFHDSGSVIMVPIPSLLPLLKVKSLLPPGII